MVVVVVVLLLLSLLPCVAAFTALSPNESTTVRLSAGVRALPTLHSNSD